MLRLLIPVILALVGAGAGVGAGLYLQPQEEEMVGDPCGPGHDAETKLAEKENTADKPPEDSEFVRINNQFIIPVIDDGAVRSLVVLSLSLETGAGGRELVHAREPKLRDSFLRVLFDHANSGGFTGTFTAADRITQLRRLLLEAARVSLGDSVRSVLVTDIARQDT